MTNALVPVLEIGGTHASAIEVDTGSWAARPVAEVPLRGDASAPELLDALAGCAGSLAMSADATLTVAIPGPFDYESGVGGFAGVGKFEALNGVDVGAGLRSRLSPSPGRIVFVNDAAAFGLGEWLVGAGRGTSRMVAITLGTGVGSAFVADGMLVTDGADVPPNGYVYRLTVNGRPLESVVSRRAILAGYAARCGAGDGLDVRDIAARAEHGDTCARESITGPVEALGTALAPWLARFEAQSLVVGGAMSRSWSLVAPALHAGMHAAEPSVDIPIRKAQDPAAGAAIGAAWHAVGDRRKAGKGCGTR